MAPLHLPSPAGRLGSQELIRSYKAFPHPESFSSQDMGTWSYLLRTPSQKWGEAGCIWAREAETLALDFNDMEVT